MASLVTLEQVRAHLRVDDTTDAALIEGMVAAAERAVEIATERTIAPGLAEFGPEDSKIAAQAVLLLVTTWYDNRDGLGSGQATAELPHAVTWLLWPLKRLTV
jgi:uncharacterized phage protein (predicted DNA packaging)